MNKNKLLRSLDLETSVELSLLQLGLCPTLFTGTVDKVPESWLNDEQATIRINCEFGKLELYVSNIVSIQFNADGIKLIAKAKAKDQVVSTEPPIPAVETNM